MTKRNELLASIAATIKDYRHGEIDEPTPEHVDRWIHQFGEEVQVPMLRELNHVFKQTYISKPVMRQFLTEKADGIPLPVLQSSYILNVQRGGESQSEIIELFDEVIKNKHGINTEYGKYENGDLMYFDDAVFSGNSIIRDLLQKIREAPQKSNLIIIVFASHTSAEFRIKRTFANVNVYLCRKRLFENRIVWPTQTGEDVPTDVLRPCEIRQRSQSKRASSLYSSVAGRELLEKEFFHAGKEIRKRAENPNHFMKPLGYSNLEPGFGSLFVTYRNCPNNCPLALWYGDPRRPATHPLHRYPLFPRKTYNQSTIQSG